MALTQDDKDWIADQMDRTVRDAVREMVWTRLDDGDRNRANLARLLGRISTRIGQLAERVGQSG